MKLFAPEGSAGGCASGDCAPAELSLTPTAPERDEPEEFPEPGQSLDTDQDKWRRAVDAVREASPRHGKSLSYARFLGFVPEGARIVFPPDAAFHRAQVVGMSRSIVEAELARALGRPTKLVEESGPQAFAQAPKSIAEVEASDRASRERGIEQKVREHPAVRNVLLHLGGAIEHISYLEPASKPAAPPASANDEAEGSPPPAD